MSTKKTTKTKAKSKTAAKAKPLHKAIAEARRTVEKNLEAIDAAEGGKNSGKAKTTKAKKVKNDAKPKRLSALDAAAQVLTEAKEPLTTKALIEAMAQQGLWTSPNGKTPDRTLYSALKREINTKGKDARFVKAERGKFTIRG